MAFDTPTRRRQSEAYNILDQVRNIYSESKALQTTLNRYQAGTDPVFNTAVNGNYPASELTTLGQMLGNLNTLTSAWEANASFRAALGLPEL